MNNEDRCTIDTQNLFPCHICPVNNFDSSQHVSNERENRIRVVVYAGHQPFLLPLEGKLITIHDYNNFQPEEQLPSTSTLTIVNEDETLESFSPLSQLSENIDDDPSDNDSENESDLEVYEIYWDEKLNRLLQTPPPVTDLNAEDADELINDYFENF